MIDVAISTKGEATVDKQLDKVDDGLKDIKKSADKASASMSAGFKASADAASLIPGPIGTAATAMQGLTGATSTFTAALKTVKGALIATGVGAFVVIVGTLIAYFTETEKGAQKLRTIMAGLGAVVRTVADAMMSLDFRNLTTNIKENTQAAIANAKALNAVEEAEGDLTVKRAEANKEITRARLIADDLTKSTEERIEAVKRAGDIEKQVAAEELTIQRQRLAAMESNLNMKKDASEEERDLVDQAKVRLADLERETLMREKRLGSEVQSLKNEQAAKDKEADAARLEAVKARNEKEAELTKQKAEAEKKAAEEAVRLAKEAADRQQTIDSLTARLQAAGLRLSAGDRFVIGAAQTLMARAADDLSFDEIKADLESILLAEGLK
jgi:chromosome segregation ATPase